MSIFQKIIRYFLYLYRVKKLEVKEPSYCLPISYELALKKIKRENSSCYKIYPKKGYMTFGKVLLKKVNVDFNNIKEKYIYSSWLNKSIEDREYLKFSEDEYDFMHDLIKETLDKESQEKYSYKKNNIKPGFEYLEEALMKKDFDDQAKEYLLDHIFKYYPERLYDLIDSIYSTVFSDYIKEYYSRLIILLFNYLDFSQLLSYLNRLENIYTSDSRSDKVKKQLLEIIQKKTLLEVQKEKYCN